MKLIGKVCFFIMLGILMSCSDDNGNVVEQEIEETSNYYALTVGNSWTYDLYRRINLDGEFEIKDFKLTKTITGTEEINGEEYFVFTNSSTGTFNCNFCNDEIGNIKVRDSLGYLISSEGVIKFSNESINPYIISSNDLGEIIGEFVNGVNQIETGAGLYENVNFNKRYFVFNDGSIAPGQDRVAYREREGLIIKETAGISSGVLQVMVLSDSVILEE